MYTPSQVAQCFADMISAGFAFRAFCEHSYKLSGLFLIEIPSRNKILTLNMCVAVFSNSQRNLCKTVVPPHLRD